MKKTKWPLHETFKEDYKSQLMSFNFESASTWHTFSSKAS
jgi:hypothetical protein